MNINHKKAGEYHSSNRSIPDDAVCFFKDGDKWCCVYGDFINLQESPAGFGDNFIEALDDLSSTNLTRAEKAFEKFESNKR